MASIDFYFDFISPYGYFASLRIDDIAARHGRTVQWRPMLLGVSVMKVMGLKPLLDTPLKGDYVVRDVLRHARRDGVALRRDPRGPMMNPLPCGRALSWLRVHQPQAVPSFVHAALHAYWAEACDLGMPAALGQLDAAAGLSPGTLQAAAASDEAAALLRADVDAALKTGVFGSPFIVIDGEPFWGHDRLADVERWLIKPW